MASQLIHPGRVEEHRAILGRLIEGVLDLLAGRRVITQFSQGQATGRSGGWLVSQVDPVQIEQGVTGLTEVGKYFTSGPKSLGISAVNREDGGEDGRRRPSL